MIKMVVSDVDGTLLKKGEEKISCSISDLIDKLKKSGIIFAVASGRHLSELKEIFDNSNDIYYISSDGGCIEFNGEIIYHRPIDDYIIKKYLNRENYIFQCPKYTYYTGENPRLEKELKEKFKDSLKTTDKGLTNIIKIIKRGAGFSETPPCTYEIYKDKDWQEWIKLSTSKGAAVEFLQKRENIRIKETLVIGDNFNDISMMRYAGEKVCMKASPPSLKMMCGRVCDDIEAELLKIGGQYE